MRDKGGERAEIQHPCLPRTKRRKSGRETSMKETGCTDKNAIVKSLAVRGPEKPRVERGKGQEEVVGGKGGREQIKGCRRGEGGKMVAKAHCRKVRN